VVFVFCFQVAGQGGQTFVLSPKFFHECSVSRFPINTGSESLIAEEWFNAHSEEIGQDWVTLPAEPQSGQLSHLLALVYSKDYLLSPLLPADNIGEAEENNGAKQDPKEYVWDLKARIGSQMRPVFRKERGFPGIDVSVMSSRPSLAAILDTFGSRIEETGTPTVSEQDSLDVAVQIDQLVNDTATTSSGLELDDDNTCITYVEQSSERNSANVEQNVSAGLGASSAAKRDPKIETTLNDCILHWCQDSSKWCGESCERPKLVPHLLHATYNVVDEAGEEGLSFEKLEDHLHVAGTYFTFSLFKQCVSFSQWSQGRALVQFLIKFASRIPL
jgi:hypothetical protein